MKRLLPFVIMMLFFTRCEDQKPFPTLSHSSSKPKILDSSLSTQRKYPERSLQVALIERKNEKKKRHTTPPEIIASTSRRIQDSLVIRKLNYLRSHHVDVDINEPGSRSYFLSEMSDSGFQTMITLSGESFFRIGFDNDILDYTDRFYTNGIRLDWISRVLQMNPVSRLMVPYWGEGINYYGISVVQNMYTPSTTKIGGILYGDRPYAAYLYLKSFKITNDKSRQFRQTSELDLGIIGPDSYGGWVQRSFHNSVPSNNEPLGWEYQIHNDLVINYSILFEKGILSNKYLDFRLVSSGILGTLYTNFSGGFQLRTGLMNPYFSNLGISRRHSFKQNDLRKFQLYFTMSGNAKLVGYDATLEGGMINRSSPYTFPPTEISRFVFQSSAGISLVYNGFRLDVEQFLLSPEYDQGLWHKWVHIGLGFCL